MKKRKHVFWETLLILGSVLVFRGLWHLMDKISFMDDVSFLIVSSFIGLVMFGIGVYRMAHAH
ncbi:MAG TPA: hypothetical protein VJK07_01840 [Candidatus Nanoarchaeia archaeon]|nr:hypothetical protein [Candidatus Nanoarchaeia archaeon]